MKKCLVVFSAAIYLFIAVTYLIYSPRFSPLKTTNTGNYPQVKSQPVIKSVRHIRNEGTNLLVLVHRAYKSAIENKHEMFSRLLQINLAFVFIIAGNAVLLKLMTIVARAIKSQRSQQYAYLSYCTLRI
ncbi:hypothetical protein Q3A68_04995 [Mucilaginibacter sp. BT774]|nr:hypothetical protein [Mucilaginibacter sp. BT774]